MCGGSALRLGVGRVGILALRWGWGFEAGGGDARMGTRGRMWDGGCCCCDDVGKKGGMFVRGRRNDVGLVGGGRARSTRRP